MDDTLGKYELDMDDTLYVWVDVPFPYPAEQINSQMIAPLRTFCWLPPTPVLTEAPSMHEELEGHEKQADRLADEKKDNKDKRVKNKGKGKTIGKGKLDWQRKARLKESIHEDGGHFARSQSHLQSQEFQARRIQHLQLGQRNRSDSYREHQWQEHQWQDHAWHRRLQWQNR